MSRLLGDIQPAIVRVVLLVFVMVASAAVALDAGVRHRDYFTEYPSQILPHFQYGLQEAVSYVHAREADYDEIWMADINQPQIYVLFYKEWPPSDVHESLTVQRAPPHFNRPISLGKYRFGDPPWTSAEDLDLAHTVRYPNGQVAYEIRAGQPEGHGRVLVVSRP